MCVVQFVSFWVYTVYMNVWCVYIRNRLTGWSVFVFDPTVYSNNGNFVRSSTLRRSGLWRVDMRKKNQYLIWSQYTCEYPIRANTMRTDAERCIFGAAKTNDSSKKKNICLAKRLTSERWTVYNRKINISFWAVSRSGAFHSGDIHCSLFASPNLLYLEIYIEIEQERERRGERGMERTEGVRENASPVSLKVDSLQRFLVYFSQY